VSTSQIFGALDALVAIAQAALPAGVDTIDGPFATQPAEQDYLVVGVDQPPPHLGQAIRAVNGSSAWVGVGGQHRDETFSIWCMYVAYSSDPTFTLSRARAHTNIGLLETALRTGSGGLLNGALTNPAWAGLQITDVAQQNDGNGCQVHVLFSVDCRGRI
jgi:hypothetical protein